MSLAESEAPAANAAHAARLTRLRAAHAQAAAAPAPIALAKATSNLFRHRRRGARGRLDLRDFDHVLALDAAAGWVDAEGLTSYEALVAATLPHGVVPAVVPQLKTITVGGAAAGVGIEATSFRHGLVHDTLREIEVLLADGDVVRCTPDNDHRDLFFGFPNSYGTLGYALRLRLGALPARPFVHVRHRRYARPQDFLAALAAAWDGEADFLDGVVFGPDRHVLSVARFTDEAPRASRYGVEGIYYRSLLARDEDWLSAAGYLWRWDADWFWCARRFGVEHPLVRRLLGQRWLGSRTYARWMRWNARWGLADRLARWHGRHPESVVQDVDIPLAHAGEFLAFLHRAIGIVPIWICPIRPACPGARFPLYPLADGVRYLNFGFWDVVDSVQPYEPGHFNRLVEREVASLGGIKSLYSDCFFTRDEFERAYGGAAYAALKAKYDPRHRLPDLYDKCVGAA